MTPLFGEFEAADAVRFCTVQPVLRHRPDGVLALSAGKRLAPLLPVALATIGPLTALLDEVRTH